MRISDWSSDVCSSDLLAQEFNGTLEDYTDFVLAKGPSGTPTKTDKKEERRAAAEARERVRTLQSEAAKQLGRSDVEGKRGSVRVDLGGRRIIQKNIARHPISRT